MVQWTAFPLHPNTPKKGLTLQELFAGRDINIGQLLAKLKQTADTLGLPFGDREKTYNSRMAQELGKWAEAENAGDRFHQAVFQAYFAEGINIGRAKHLMAIAESVGLSGDEAHDILVQRTFKQQVDEDWNRSLEMGVTAVPTFVMNGRLLVGAHSFDQLYDFIHGKVMPSRIL